MKLHAWGRLSNDEHTVVDIFDRTRIEPALHEPGTPWLAHGLGRSYGDVCLNPNGRVLRMRGASRLLEFDETSGLLTCEAGVTLAEIGDVFVPRGWRLRIVPGTEQVTVGGAIANDVHGKSHHMHGAFSQQVERLWLQRSDEPLLEVSREATPELFAATVGGIGLTGVITAATLRLDRVASAYIDAETLAFQGLSEFDAISTDSGSWENSVAWIDCMSGREPRGLFTRGNPSPDEGAAVPGRRLAMPVTPPVSLVNPLSLRVFNTAYFEAGKRGSGHSVQHYTEFFFPLDRIAEWNRAYGPRGFYQYQSVIPPHAATAATQEMLDAIRAAGQGSFLAVLKRFGSIPSEGMLSFATEGTTLAVDFPNRGDETLRLLSRLDNIVLAAGGRLYLAKDARMPHTMFTATYPRIAEFEGWRDPAIASAMSARLFGRS